MRVVILLTDSSLPFSLQSHEIIFYWKVILCSESITCMSYPLKLIPLHKYLHMCIYIYMMCIHVYVCEDATHIW